MKKRKTLAELCDERYDDPDVAQFVLSSVADAGTEDKIMSGERVLPHPIDAERNYLKSIGQWQQTATERSQATEIKALQERLSAVETAQKGSA